jgi:hypothetical protein
MDFTSVKTSGEIKIAFTISNPVMYNQRSDSDVILTPPLKCVILM